MTYIYSQYQWLLETALSEISKSQKTVSTIPFFKKPQNKETIQYIVEQYTYIWQNHFFKSKEWHRQFRIVTLEMNTYNIGHFDSWIEWCTDWYSLYCFASQPLYMTHYFIFLLLHIFWFYQILHWRGKKIFQNHSLYFKK